MQLRRITLENFRCYAAGFSIAFDDFIAIVGRNDVGKSSILEALEIFFDAKKPEIADVALGGNGPIRITCEFDDLPESVVIDADFTTTLVAERLLTTQGRLAIRKTYAGATLKPTVEIIADHPTAEGANDLLLLKRSDLIARANQQGVPIPAGNANAPLRAAIWNSYDNLALQMIAVPVDKEGAKQIWSALEGYLPVFALFKADRESSDQDPEAQDPLKAAIKEALKEVEADLAAIQARVQQEVQRIADSTVAKIREMDPAIAETLSPVISPKKWESLFQTSITGDEGVPINKRGSGVRRLILLSFFRAQAEELSSKRKSSRVIYAIEEPETSQHPRNQRMLLAALRDLASSGRQVLITTHTPNLARGLDLSSLRLITTDETNIRTVASADTPNLNEKIADSLGVLPDHNIKAFIGVEGQHDIAFLKHASRAFLAAGSMVPDLEALELAGQIIFVPMGGSNLALWTSRLKGLNIPEVHLCDRDNPPPADPKYKDHVDGVNARPGCLGLHTTRREMENYVHPAAIVEAYADQNIPINLPAQFQSFDDVPDLVARAVHAASSPEPWPPEGDKAKKKRSQAKAHINSNAMAKMTAARFGLADNTDEVLGWLQKINAAIAHN